jgi:predicted DCC family thiol-disulfide oxidoreductase YuxK
LRYQHDNYNNNRVRSLWETYDAIGLGWVFALTNHPAVVAEVPDNLYDMWAENRLRLAVEIEVLEYNPNQC